MVMHARKLSRLDDGYFERHQSHPYQANPKYSSKPGYAERFNSERARDSPNGTLRTDSPGSFGDSPHERYGFKGSYSQRVREKERDRANRSPKDRDRACRDQPEDDRRGTYDRGPVPEDPKDREKGAGKTLRMGDWSEHTSSSGKKYYYNVRTEMSQWEKPREWSEWEKEKEREKERERERERDRNRENREREKHRNKERDRRYDRQNLNSLRTGNGPSDRHSSPNHRSHGSSNDYGPSNSSRSSDPNQDSRESYRVTYSRRQSDDRPSQDMDISPGDSTPTSEASVPKSGTPYTPDPRSTPTTATGSVSLAAALPRLISHPPTFMGTPSSGGVHKQGLIKPPLQSPQRVQGLTSAQLNMLQQMLTSSGSVTITSITSLLSSVIGGPVNLNSLGLGALQHLEGTELSAHEVLQALQTALLMSSGGPTNQAQATMLPNLSGSDSLGSGADGDSMGSGGGGGGSGGGPPTPTHSERLDSQDIRKGSPATGLSSLSAAAASLRPSPTSTQALTPSLAAYFRQDLISHVTGWPSEQLEKQAQKCSEELHSIGNLQVTKVSAELKMARSLVRVADIQATLQEQRILFLRQQMKEIEELKPPSHFISD